MILIFDLISQVEKLSSEWKESTQRVIEQKRQLEEMLKESEQLNELNESFNHRLNEMDSKLSHLVDIGFMGKDTLRKQKFEYKQIRSEMNELSKAFVQLKELFEHSFCKYESNRNDFDLNLIKSMYDRCLIRFDDLNNK